MDSPGNMEGLPTTMTIASHAGSRSCFALPALFFTDVTSLQQEQQDFICFSNMPLSGDPKMQFYE